MLRTAIYIYTLKVVIYFEIRIYIFMHIARSFYINSWRAQMYSSYIELFIKSKRISCHFS